jgi:hypothetical protein
MRNQEERGDRHAVSACAGIVCVLHILCILRGIGVPPRIRPAERTGGRRAVRVREPMGRAAGGRGAGVEREWAEPLGRRRAWGGGRRRPWGGAGTWGATLEEGRGEEPTGIRGDGWAGGEPTGVRRAPMAGASGTVDSAASAGRAPDAGGASRRRPRPERSSGPTWRPYQARRQGWAPPVWARAEYLSTRPLGRKAEAPAASRMARRPCFCCSRPRQAAALSVPEDGSRRSSGLYFSPQTVADLQASRHEEWSPIQD